MERKDRCIWLLLNRSYSWNHEKPPPMHAFKYFKRWDIILLLFADILKPNRKYSLPFGRLDPHVVEGRRELLQYYLGVSVKEPNFLLIIVTLFEKTRHMKVASQYILTGFLKCVDGCNFKAMVMLHSVFEVFSNHC